MSSEACSNFTYSFFHLSYPMVYLILFMYIILFYTDFILTTFVIF